jgi:hypothetical protein
LADRRGFFSGESKDSREKNLDMIVLYLEYYANVFLDNSAASASRR